MKYRSTSIAIVLLVLLGHVHAQFSKVNSVTFQQGGVTQSFFTYPYTINFTGCTVTPGGATVAIACSGAASVAPVQTAHTQTGATADVQISNAIAALSGGSGVVWADYATNQTWAACPTWGSGNIDLVLYPVLFSVSVSCTVPSNVHLSFLQGAGLSPATGTITTLAGSFLAPQSKIFYNATAGLGTMALANPTASDNGGQVLIDVYPEWWGATASDSTGATNTPAIQAAIYAGYGCGPVACRTNATAFPKYNRVLHFSTLYWINAELKVYHMNGFQWEGETPFNSGLKQSTCNLRIIDGQSDSYGTFERMRFENGCGASSTQALVDLDFSGAQGSDLTPSYIDFRNIFLVGNTLTDVGILIAKSGGSAGGYNIDCWKCVFSGFTGAGWQVGGDNTGRNAGRFQATNALDNNIEKSDFLGNPLYGMVSYSGQTNVKDSTFEDDSAGFGTQTGFDMYCYAAQTTCVFENDRSESHKLAAGSNIRVINSQTIFQATQWYSSSRGQCLAGTTLPVGSLFSGTGVGGDGAYYKVTVSSSAFGGLCNTSATGGSATTITVSGTPWTVNAFTGYRATLVSGTGIGQYCIVTSNTSSTITCSGGWLTSYVNSPIQPWTFINPDATTVFAVEPNWGTQTTSGGMTWAAATFDVIEGDAGGISVAFLDTVGAPGGQIRSTGYMRNVTVSRADWQNVSNPLEDTIINAQYNNISIFRPDSVISVGGTGQHLAWAFARNGAGASAYNDWAQFQMGGLTAVWSHGGPGGGLALPDVWFGLNGARLATFTFAALPSTAPYNANGVVVYCSDCNSTCTAGSSTGRTCFRENGAWTH